MRTPERDMQSIRLVGGFLLLVGSIQLVLTLVIALFGLFAGVSSDVGSFSQGLLAVAMSILMASITTSCAISLQRFKVNTHSGIQQVRLLWTTLVLVYVVAGIAALWVNPTLTTLAVLLELALFTIRGSIIRLTG
jgi:hypothetical protein